ncbi:MAG: acetyltransferase [Synergistaceae bacterium]|nr:acetyltransferase [Synergistaceae bacterium]
MMEKRDKVFLIGAGDHAKVVLSTLEACGVECAGIYDDNPELWGRTFWCLPIIGPVSEMPDTPETMAVIAIGSNVVRRKIRERFREACWPVFVHPMAIVHSSVRLGEGTVVFAGCIIESDAVIGKQSIINSGCFIGHDSRIGDFCHMAPKSAIADSVTLGNGVFLGLGSMVRPYTTILDDVTIGMGSSVVKKLGPCGTYVGTPAKRIMTPVIDKD